MATEIAFPEPPLRDEVVALRPWREDDVPERIMGFADPSVLRFSRPRATPYTEADAREFFETGGEGQLRSHMAFQGGRRDTVVFSLLPGELR